MVLAAPRNPLNIGAAARAMSNFGFPHLRVVNPYEVAFQEARSAVGAAELLQNAQQFPSIAEAVADVTLVVGTTSIGHRQLQHSIHRLEAAGRLIREQAETGPVALLFGSEKFGLSNEELSYCHWLTRVPTRDEHGSMNLGQAVAVCLYELIREREEENFQPAPVQPAGAEAVERFTNLLIEALRESGYVNERIAASTEQKVRRMVRRLDIPARDVETWQGMVRQILWKLRSGQEK